MSELIRVAWRRFEDPLELLSRAKDKLYSIWLGLTYPFASIGKKLSAHYPCHLKRPLAVHIAIGDSVFIGEDTFIHFVCDGTDSVKLAIGDNCVIGARSVISSKNSIMIERDVIMGSSVLIQDHQHARERTDVSILNQGVTVGGRIRIEQGCWIGQGAAILCNTGELVIGRNSVVGVNSVVSRSLPPYSVIVGNPGIALKQMSTAKEQMDSKAGGATDAHQGGVRRSDDVSSLASSGVHARLRDVTTDLPATVG